MTSISAQISQLPGVNPVPGIVIPATETFNPTIHKLDQVDAIEATALLRDHKFTEVGSAEIHSGIHPIYGKCIISIYDSYASLIPFA